MDDIIDRFVDKVKILINDEDEKRKIMRMIKKVLENRKYSKKAKDKFQQILVKSMVMNLFKNIVGFLNEMIIIKMGSISCYLMGMTYNLCSYVI